MRNLFIIASVAIFSFAGFGLGANWQMEKDRDILSDNLFNITHTCRTTAMVIAGPDNGYSVRCIGEEIEEKDAFDLLKA